MTNIDTLRFSKDLIRGGFTPQQAEILSEKMAELVEDQVVSKPYLDMRIGNVELKIIESKNELEAKIADVELKIAESQHYLEAKIANVELKIAESKNDLLKWLVPILIGQAGAIVALIKFL